MHLTFVNSDGLEQSALSFLAVNQSNSQVDPQQKKMTMAGGDRNCSDDEEEFLVIDENSPLLLDLDPPETRRSYVEGNLKKKKYNSLLSFKIRRTKREGLPWVIFFTALGMAAMVLIGFMTMFQDTASVDPPTTPVADDISNQVAVDGNEVIVPPPSSSPAVVVEPNVAAPSLNVNPDPTAGNNEPVNSLKSLGNNTNPQSP